MWGRLLLVLLLGLPRAPDAGNLWPNGSFEAGLDFRLAAGRWYAEGPESWTLDPVLPGHGRQSLRIPYTRRGAAAGPPDLVEGATVRAAVPVDFPAPGPRWFGVQLRSSLPVEGVLVLTSQGPGETEGKPLASRPILVGRNWKWHDLGLDGARPSPLYWEIRIRSDRPGDLWVDGVHLGPVRRNGPAEDEALAVTLSSDRPGHVHDAGQAPVITLAANQGSGTGRTALLTTYDLGGREVARQEIPLPADTRPVTLRAAVPGNGVYRSVVTVPGTEASSQLSYSVLPEPRPVAPGDSAFGIYGTLAETPLRILSRAGFRWLGNLTSNSRLIYWDQVEPREGEFRWYDADVARARDLGFELMLNLEPCRTPRWARALPLEVQREKWQAYVRAMVRHYSPAVRHWTIGDEVHSARGGKNYMSRCWRSPREYGAWHQAGHAAIKAEDPGAVVIMNTWNDFGRDTLAAIGPGSTDVLAMNAWHVPESLGRMVPVAREYGIRRLWAPGVAVPERPFYPEHTPAGKRAELGPGYWQARNRLLTRSVVETLSLGVERLFHYTGTFVGNTNLFSLFEADGGLKPTGAQFAALAWLLDGVGRAASVEVQGFEPPVRAFRLDRRDGQTLFVVWGSLAEKQAIRLRGITPGEVRALDSFGNPLPARTVGDALEIRPGSGALFLEVPGPTAHRIGAALASPVVHLQSLPAADRTLVRGRYAVLENPKDVVFRQRPRRSLWYRTGSGRWVEVFRNRASHVQPDWHLDEQGLELRWQFQRPAAAFYLEPGMFPTDLAIGADWRRQGPAGSRPADTGTVQVRGGRLVVETRGRGPAGPPGAPHDILLATRAGLELRVQTWLDRSAPQAMVPGAWEVQGWEGREVFLHHVYAAGQAGPLGLRSRVQVTEIP